MSGKFIDLVESKKLPTPVDCGNCPVNMACALGQGGNGYTFDCCHATGFQTEVDGRTVMYLIDCQRHAFEQNRFAKMCKLCPLCSGDIVEVAMRDISQSNVYLPTVHAKVPVADRVRLWRDKLPQVRERLKAETRAMRAKA
jgi:hypothetical protein